MVKINGIEKELPANTTVSQYLEYLESQGYRINLVAVERNGDIVPKSAYDATLLQDLDELEVVSFVGGG